MPKTVTYHARVIVTRTIRTEGSVGAYSEASTSKHSEQANLNIGGSDLVKLIEKISAHMQLLDEDDFTDNRQTSGER